MKVGYVAHWLNTPFNICNESKMVMSILIIKVVADLCMYFSRHVPKNLLENGPIHPKPFNLQREEAKVLLKFLSTLSILMLLS